MKLLDHVHGTHVHTRRVRVLSDHFSRVIAHGARVLDVGAGDGLLARTLADQRPDIDISGIDVGIRSATHVPVEPFDGERIPHADGAFDVVMFVDVLHHTTHPMELLREAVRTSRGFVVIKDHFSDGFLATPTLRLMDHVSNLRHGVALPYNYWTRAEWDAAFEALGLRPEAWLEDLRLYPFPASLLFDRSLHFVASLAVGARAAGPR
jgi:SAM-dependent methyltransferase